MATSIGDDTRQPVPIEDTNGHRGNDDPFASETPPSRPQNHRYSSFDTQLFALNHPSSSPAQAKKALEAHLAETDRRIQETSKLGTSLVQQRQHLSQRLRDVGSQEEDSQISPELRQKLVDIEREYNEVGRQSARAFLGPKSSSQGDGPDTPFALDGRNPASPTKFSSQATDSPSKVNVPRKQRNQASRADDIEFAAEITTSLLGQVRHLQGVLVERDEALKAANSEKSRLEFEAEGFTQRLRSLDESEQRYKDENWNLETQMQDINAAAKEAATREQKLQQSLAFATSEKNTAQRELDDLKQDHTKISEDYAMVRKTHESELASLRKNVNLGESEKSALQRKIEELTSQNRELANGLAGRFREDESDQEAQIGQTDDFLLDLSEREHSPPPSPTKGGQRHSMLESETLKSSLHHAHRMIQNLKSNVHREKSEKQDLKRLLQEARDELAIRRAEPNEKRLKSKSHTDMRRAARPGLGAARNSKTDVMIDDPAHDPEWEDHEGGSTPSRDLTVGPLTSEKSRGPSRLGDNSDAYQTANETEDAFETAEERDTTDNDAFETGAESMAGDSSDDMTETETGVARGGTLRGKQAAARVSAKAADRRSIQSTASTSDDEPDQNVHTPVQGQAQRFRLKMNRNSRRSRVGSGMVDSSTPSTAKNSPASFVNGGEGGGQTLYNELENLSGDENDGTPSKGSISSRHSTQSLRRSLSGRRSWSNMRRSTSSQPSTPGIRPSTMVYAGDEAPPVPKLPTVDTGTMTESWEPDKPAQATQNNSSPASHSDSSSALPTTSMAAITSRIFGGTPYTPPAKDNSSQPASGSRFGSRSSSTSTQPRPVWDQPLQMFSGSIPGFGQSADSTPLSTRSATSQARAISGSTPDAQRQQVYLPNGATVTPKHTREPSAITPPSTAYASRQVLGLSPIQSVETAPTRTSQKPATTTDISHGANNASQASSAGGIFGSVFGWNKRRSSASTAAPSAEKERMSQTSNVDVTAGENATHGEVSTDASTPSKPDRPSPQTPTQATPVSMSDNGAQTLLSSGQIDSLLAQRAASPVSDNQRNTAAAAMKPLSAIGAVSPPLQTNRGQDPLDTTPKGKAPEMVTYKDSLGKTFKRPASSSSMRPRTSQASQYPPLPPDHQEAIAAAASRTPSAEASGSMGPPLAPASAYRSQTARSRGASRPQTPSQQGYPSPSSKGGTTPRAGRYSTARSQVSRRSSVSSFASELDERFNIRADGMPMVQGISANTDPRMIQAITQTMIGEMMWKYTRKAGRGEMSSTRHRRFFWVHPYTRTLYWSDRDPATADRAQLKSKSVAIEAVRVVTDDNPMPPGLHRKSLVIVTPGRAVKFTAQTSQRHETWFNALSYLLLRTGPDGTMTNNADDLTDTDVAEFNPGYSRRTSRSRVSLASFSSKRNQNRQDRARLSARDPPAGTTTAQNQALAPPTPSKESVRRRISRSLSRSRPWAPDAAESPERPLPSDTNEQRGSVATRRKSFIDSVRNSMRSRTSMRHEEPELPEPGVLEGGRNVVTAAGGDSAEDLRRVIEAREQGGKLENVRSCCDGMYLCC
ncbi:hypothetical protein ACLMJK_002976 [Lecanora helva]